MFMFTAKLDKRKILIALFIVIALAAVLILVFGGKDSTETAAFSKVVKNNAARVEYLESFGWKVDTEPIDSQTVLIPKTMTDTYADYNEIQKAQGFDLSQYAGMEAVRYTYSVTNYPDQTDVVADIIVYRNHVIAGDIQSVALDGFMHGLEFPKEN